MFGKVLIANRGEIAVRIARTLQAMGIRVAVVCSEADRAAMHVRCADEAFDLPGVAAGETYLRGDRIIEIARACGAEAIHPGYGFLSENAAFAKACGDAGIVFVGPTPDAITAMGDKITARKLMTDAGVPVVPGATIGHGADAETIRQVADDVGYPVLIKAAAGGGGKGMRVVRDPADLIASADAARREAAAAFGDDRVFVEKYIDSPRHVEFQIFGDASGAVVHLFERECSIQRRHQKIIEESPSPMLDGALRERMGRAAVDAARAIGYVNAGTVEFIVDPSGAFYFLEVNTRLQVEHPVTESVTGLDLVRLQMQVAAGERLPFAQDDLRQRGHAIECRVYAEDPAHGFLPSVGRIARFIAPDGPNVRVDAGVAAGDEVSVHYDPMIAKLVTWDGTRSAAIERMAWALDRFAIMGVTTNIGLLRRVVTHPEFAAGRIDTHFLDRHDLSRDAGESIPDEAWLAAAVTLSNGGNDRSDRANGGSRAVHRDPWRAAGAWRGV